MNLSQPTSTLQHRNSRGSVLVIVLWVCVGLVGIALYFANSMTYELRASNNRVCGMEAEQAIEGASKYVSAILFNYATNGAVPDSTLFSSAAVPIGDAKFWLIGRDTTAQGGALGQTATELTFGLIDEGSKLNLNCANTNALSYLPNMTYDFAEAIVDWSSTNQSAGLDYSALGYYPKYAPFETVDELRLVYGATVDLMYGDDFNQNGVLDGNEKDTANTGSVNSGLIGYTTVWTREPNFHSDGTSLTNVSAMLPASTGNVRTRQQTVYTNFLAFFQKEGVSAYSADANALATQYGRVNPAPTSFSNIVAFALFCQQAGMNRTDFEKIYNDVTTAGTNTTYFVGRVNVNTAGMDVLTALFMGLSDNISQETASGAADTLISYRAQNPDNLNSIWWIIDALGNNNQIITALAASPGPGGGGYVTTHSFQFTADIAAVGEYGRGYRRVKFVFDTSRGAPIIVYRQDLSRLGWALGDTVRQTLLANNTTP